MRQVSLEVLPEENRPTLPNYDKVLSPEFLPRDSYHATKRNDQFVSSKFFFQKIFHTLINI